MSVENIKSDLEQAVTSEEANAIFKSAYIAGYRLRELGELVGVSGERIRQRIARPVSPDLIRDYSPHERVVRKAAEVYLDKRSRKRILGLREEAPALKVPVAVLNELARLQALVTQVRGWTPLDSEPRRAVKPYGDLLFDTIQEYGIPQTQLEKLLGLKNTTLTVWLKNHGYLPKPPSQKAYREVFVDLTNNNPRRKNPLEIGGTCRKGLHTLTAQNLGKQAAGNYCKDCTRERAAEQYQAKKSKTKTPPVPASGVSSN